MMKKKQIKKLAQQILEQEAIIADKNSLDESVKSAKEKIENIIASLNFIDIILLDDYIMENNIRANKL